MKRSRSYHQRGAASVMAVAVFGTAAATTAALAMFAAMDFCRLRNERSQLQQQQYSLAAIAQAMTQLQTNQRADGHLPLPAEAGLATLKWRTEGAAVLATVTIGRHASQLTFVQRGTNWELVESASIEPSVH